jgi:integrase
VQRMRAVLERQIERNCMNARKISRKKLPDCIRHRVAPDGRTLYRVHIRRDGVPPFSKQFDTLADAIDARDAQLGAMQKMRAGGLNTAVTLGEAINSYKKGFRFKALSRSKEREIYLDYWLERLGEHKRLASLTVPILALERDRLVRKYSKGATVCMYLTGLSQPWEWAQEALGAVPNQVTQMRWPKIRYAPPRKFSKEQLQLLLQRADGYASWRPLGLLIRLSLITTQRRGTVTSIRWEDVDLVEGAFIKRVKNGSMISCPIEGETLELMRAHHRAEKLDGRGKDRDYVFQSPTLHQPLEAKKHVDWLFDDPAFDGLTFKHLRSTSLSRLFTHAKLDVPRVMAISGHKTARVLLEHYAHADDDEKRKAIREHANMLLGG